MALERVRRHPRRGRRRAHVRPGEDPRNPGGRDDPGDGSKRIGHFVEAQILEARGRLRRRVRRCSHPPTSMVHVDKRKVRHSVRVRLHQPRRGAAAGRRCGDDPDEGRGGDRRHRQRGNAHAPSSAVSGVFAAARRGAFLLGGEGARAPYELVKWVAENGRLPVTFTAAADRDAGGRRALHAARRADAPSSARAYSPGAIPSGGDRRGDDAFRGREGARRRLRGARRSHGRTRPPAGSKPTGSKSAAGERRGSASSLSRATSRARGDAAAARRRTPRGSQAGAAGGARRPARGESMTFGVRLMRLYGLDEAVRRFEALVFGTCAGT